MVFIWGICVQDFRFWRITQSLEFKYFPFSEISSRHFLSSLPYESQGPVLLADLGESCLQAQIPRGVITIVLMSPSAGSFAVWLQMETSVKVLAMPRTGADLLPWSLPLRLIPVSTATCPWFSLTHPSALIATWTPTSGSDLEETWLITGTFLTYQLKVSKTHLFNWQKPTCSRKTPWSFFKVITDLTLHFYFTTRGPMHEIVQGAWPRRHGGCLCLRPHGAMV